LGKTINIIDKISAAAALKILQMITNTKRGVEKMYKINQRGVSPDIFVDNE
jgi:hypothetical protein